MQAIYLIALANLVICMAVDWVCMHRIAMMSLATKRSFRVNYSIMFVAAVASGLQPILFNEFPGYADLIMNTALLSFLYGGRKHWRTVPHYAKNVVRDEYLPSVSGGKK